MKDKICFHRLDHNFSILHLHYLKRTDPEYMGNVVSNCSFSKIFSPGVRLGWIEASYKIIHLLQACGIAMSGGGFNHLMSMIMNSAILLGHLDTIVEENRAVVKVV